MSKITYTDVKVTKKYKDSIGYMVYEGTFVRVTKTIFKTVSEEGTFTYHEAYKSYIKINKERLSNIDHVLISDIIRSSEFVVAEDDCCLHPDLEKCNTYPTHDILYAHILDRYEVLDYDFVGIVDTKEVYIRPGNIEKIAYMKGYIKFKDTKYEYEYEFDVTDKISTYACLTCESIIKDEEKKLLCAFDDWVALERLMKDRKEQANKICMDSIDEYTNS